MISTLTQTTTSFVEELAAHAVPLSAAPLDTVLLGDVVSIHATRIDVLVESTVAGQIWIRTYGAAKAVAVESNIGAVPAGTPTRLVYGVGTNEAVGQTFDLFYRPTGGVPAPGDTATIWAAARQ